MEAAKLFDHSDGRSVTCGDATLYVEERGMPGAPALLLLHGGFGNLEDFNGLVPSLAASFRLIGIDSRGHGRSSLGSTPLSYALLADDLAQVIDTLGLEEYHILGFSDGGIAAYRYAARQDPRLGKLLTVGASWEMSEAEPAWELLSGMTAELWQGLFPASYQAYRRLNPQPDFDRLAAAVLTMWCDLGPDGHPGPLMSWVACDTLVVRGDDDPLTSLASLARLRGEKADVHLLNIPFAEHVAFDDAPDIFLPALGRFFGITLPCP